MNGSYFHNPLHAQIARQPYLCLMSDKYKIRDQELPYYITFATEGWVDVFTRKDYRDIVLESLRFCQMEKGLVIYAWCLMSNHMHLIVGVNGDGKIQDVIRDFKKYTSVQICRAIEGSETESRKEWMLAIFRSAAETSSKHQKYKFWQDDYHPIELTSNVVIDQKINYIHDNPVKDQIVDDAEAYVYSSARDYAGMKGLLGVEFVD